MASERVWMGLWALAARTSQMFIAVSALPMRVNRTVSYVPVLSRRRHRWGQDSPETTTLSPSPAN